MIRTSNALCSRCSLGPFPAFRSGLGRRRSSARREAELGQVPTSLVPVRSRQAKRGGACVKVRALSGLPLFATLASLAAAGDAIARRTRVGKALTGPVATMLCGAVLVNLPLGEWNTVNLIELKAAQSFLVTVSTPLLLMGTNLRSIVKGAGPLVPGFLVGSLGSLVGSVLGCAILGDRLSETLLLVTRNFASSGVTAVDVVANDVAGIAAALAAKNIGGGFNFVAVAESANVSPATLALGLAADNVAALIYFPLSAFVAGLGLQKQSKAKTTEEGEGEGEGEGKRSNEVTTTSAEDLTLVLAFSGAIIIAVQVLFGSGGNTIAYCSALTILLATLFPSFFEERLKTPGYTLARVFLSLFFSSAGLAGGKVIGLDGTALLPIASLLLIIYVTHILSVAFAKVIFKMTPLESALVSNAAVGGPATAAALATSKETDATPAILVGNLGNAIATFAGLAILPCLRAIL